MNNKKKHITNESYFQKLLNGVEEHPEIPRISSHDLAIISIIVLSLIITTIVWFKFPAAKYHFIPGLHSSSSEKPSELQESLIKEKALEIDAKFDSMVKTDPLQGETELYEEVSEDDPSFFDSAENSSTEPPKKILPAFKDPPTQPTP